ncbi:Rad60/SUMO-like domain containing protein [Trema orientale]|uniref:Rad60/SUMO-like domain containing protein n=1 Tax=Trema orientale TaxID=63057 RepID=A0A2P5F274_TREOI|nr:Rad60/SUMO-like domain containing protein [Trema orientale]
MASPNVTNHDDETKPVVHSRHINLKIKGQQRTSPLELLMKEYCNQMSLDLNSIVFLYDGHIIKPLQTPDQLRMEEGDLIDAMLHQFGGAFI